MKLGTRRLMRSVIATVFVALLATSDARAQHAPKPTDAESYRSHLLFLADPGMEGRGPGLPGNRKAAEYLESRFKSLGLQPAFPGGIRPGSGELESPSYFQRFTAGRDVKVGRSTVSFAPINVAAGSDPSIERQTLVEKDDYVVLGNSGSASVEGELAFVGYSIEPDERGGVPGDVASYGQSDDLTGKIVLLFRFEPLNERGKSRLTSEGNWSPASAISQKIMAAVSRHAAGIILVSPPGVDDRRAFRLESPEASATWTRQLDIPAVMLSGPAAERLVKMASADPELRTLLDLRKRADSGRAGLGDDQSAVISLTKARVKLDTEVSRVDRETWNVGAILPGAGPLSSQFVVVGAHFDHVGFGYQGGSRSNEYGVVHPGADDNASGTCGLLLAAEKLVRRYGQEAGVAGDQSSPPRRSILFLGFSAEEMGLIGSREFVKASPIESKSISAMLNMDMIGRLRPAEDPKDQVERPKLMVAGTGTAEGMAELIKPIFDRSGLYIDASRGGRGPSDHATFYGAGVPVLHFFTGLHDEYHTPRDTADLINIDGAVQITGIVCELAQVIATRPEPLVFASTDRGGDSTRDGGPGDAPAGPRMSSLRVRFGIAPGNYSDESGGVTVSEVFDGTSAAEAGIKAGDRLIRWNGEEIGDVSNWMTLLSRHKPGDVVDVQAVRLQNVKDPRSLREELTLRVTLKARDQAAR